MSEKPKKMAVLSALQEQAQPVSLPELLAILGPGFAERSVRRWLSELVSEGQVQKEGKKRGTRYHVVQTEIHFAFGEQAKIALSHIQKPLFERDPVPYNEAWLASYKPNHTFYLTQRQRDSLAATGKPEATNVVAGTYAHRIYHRLLIDLSYNSSRLEGNTYSLGDTEKLIIEGVSNSEKLDAEKIMILNHKEAIRYLVDNSTKIEINETTIRTLHFLLSDGLILSQYTGKMRDHPVKISSSTYLPLETPERLKQQVIKICELAKQITNEYEQSFFLLVHISYLQAFTDVNKRTARLSANIPFIQHNLYPIAFNHMDKEDYISSMLAMYELQDVHALAELYTASYLYTAKEYNALVSVMDFNEVRVRFRHEIRSVIREIVNTNLVGNAMKSYIDQQVKALIPPEYQIEFIKTIEEDLKNIGPERISGLGITQQQLLHWLGLFQEKK